MLPDMQHNEYVMPVISGVLLAVLFVGYPWALRVLLGLQPLPDCPLRDRLLHTSRRLSLPMKMAFLSDLENAQHAALAHGRWLVDQQLDGDRQVF